MDVTALVVAGMGIAGTLGAVVLTRWADDKQQQQWAHEDSLRWMQDRQQEDHGSGERTCADLVVDLPRVPVTAPADRG